MTEAAGPGDAFAIGDDAQYQPVAATGDQHVRALARAAGLPFRHRMIRLAGVGHTAADVLAAERTREIVFAGRRGQPRA